MTHTHMEDNPWWEVDLGSEVPVEQIVIWNRTDGDLEKRLEGYVVKVLDAARKEIFSQRPPGVPRPSQGLAVDGRREVKVRMASASFEQAGFEAARAVDANLSSGNGWAVGSRTGVPQSLVIEFEEPLCVKYGCTLSIELSQLFAHHTLGHFRAERDRPACAGARGAGGAYPRAGEGNGRNGRPTRASRLREFYGSLDPASHEKARSLAELEKKLAAIKPVADAGDAGTAAEGSAGNQDHGQGQLSCHRSDRLLPACRRLSPLSTPGVANPTASPWPSGW